jgi:hypothetical protein
MGQITKVYNLSKTKHFEGSLSKVLKLFATWMQPVVVSHKIYHRKGVDGSSPSLGYDEYCMKNIGHDSCVHHFGFNLH